MSVTSDPIRVMFVYWGRRGALSRFTFEVGRTALADPTIEPTICISRSNELFDDYVEFGRALFPVTLFNKSIGAVLGLWRLPLLRSRLLARLKEDRTQAVIALMPHVWGPLIAPAIRKAGVRYATIIHDADPHPGDPTAAVHNWGLREVDSADVVLTLSEAVARSLAASGRVPRSKLFTLFHPDLAYGSPASHSPPQPGEPLRLLFLGRILPYKGLSILLDCIDLLEAEGIAVQLGVFGEGPLAPNTDRLRQMGAEVVNRWLTGDEIGAVLRRYHAVVLSHTEASQSGIAAAALGGGVPVIATPVGGLIEQIQDGHTGVVAKRTDAPSLADATKRLLLDAQLYATICRTIRAECHNRSMERFVRECVRYATQSRRSPKSSG